MGSVIFAKQNYEIALIIITIITVNELIAIINFIMSRTSLQKRLIYNYFYKGSRFLLLI